MDVGAAWGEGDAIDGTPFRVVVAASETSGHAVVLTVDMPPGEHVLAHVHHDEDQINVVVSGRVRARVGADEAVLETGGVLLMPRGIEHELWNDSDQTAQVIEVYTPPGMEDRFAALGAIALSADLDAPPEWG